VERRPAVANFVSTDANADSRDNFHQVAAMLERSDARQRIARDIGSQEIYALDLKNRFQNPGPASWSSVKTLPSVRI